MEDDGELTSDAVLLLLKQATPSALQRLSSLASSGELRDYDDLFSSAALYRLSAALLQSCWHEYDLHHLLASDSQHDIFLYEQERRQRRQREDSGMDDEEDEEGEAAVGSQQQQDASWTRLQQAYTFVSHLLAAPECDAALAGQRAAFDQRFLTALVERFYPKKKRNTPSVAPASSSSSTASQQRPTAEQIAAIVGPGMLAGASSAPPPQQQQGGSAATSALSAVGLGIRTAEPDSPTPAELSLLRGLLHRLYALLVPSRPLLLSLIASFMQRFLRQPLFPQGVSELLAVYAAVVKGLRLPLLPRHAHWLLRNVVPLHLPNAMMNELTPLLQAYHEPLVYALVQLLTKDRQQQQDAPSPSSSSVLHSVLSGVMAAWPSSTQPNSAKEVLLLHEMERLLEFCSVDAFAAIAASFFPLLVAALSSSHHRVSERCLQLWQNDHFLSLIQSQRSALFPLLIPVLLQEKHWNGSVNKMRVTVLESCRQQDERLFAQCCHALLQLASPQLSLAEAERLMDAMRPPPDPALSEQERLLQTQVAVPASIPSVAYNEFVFGHVLGSGSFSCVRYAKRIVRGRSAAAWPEFAIKVMDRQLVAAQRYEANVEREQRIMSRFHHPNVTSLLAVCSNAHHLYFITEYAARGDLHTHLTTLGSFSADTARFVAAEIVRALQHLHGLRVLWGDCKPENVLVHASGHVKICDFGSSREEEESEQAAGGRLEGTEEYIAPEMKRGEAMSQASDLWAFACVLYQMLEGRTPAWLQRDADDEKEPNESDKRRRRKKAAAAAAAAEAARLDAVMRNGGGGSADRMEVDEEEKDGRDGAEPQPGKAVHFDADDERFSASFDRDARHLIASILVDPPAARFAVVTSPASSSASGSPRYSIDYDALMSHPFFSGIEWGVLHTLPAPALAGGTVAPAPDAKWARRKNSIMWAPMPKAYAFTDSSVVMDAIAEADAEREDKRGPAPDEAAADGRLRHVGFQQDKSMAKLEEAEDEEEGEEEDGDAEGEEPLWNGSRLRDLTGEEDDSGGSAAPPRQSSRARTQTRRSNGVDASPAASFSPAPLPPAHPPASSASSGSVSLPSRPRIAIRSAPAPSGRAQVTSASFVPDASPLSGTGLQRALGNPTAAMLLNRVLGKEARSAAAQSSHGAGGSGGS